MIFDSTGSGRRRIVLGALAAVLAAGLSVNAPLQAKNQQDSPLRVTPQEPTHERTYLPLVGLHPQQATARHPDRCRLAAVTYCDIVEVKIFDVNPDDLFQVLVFMTWPGPDKTDPQTGKVIKDENGRTQKDNDVDIYFWRERFVTIVYKEGTTTCGTPPSRSCRAKDTSISFADDQSAGIWHPEIVSLADLQPTGKQVELPIEDPEKEERRYEENYYYVTPLNSVGVNQGYTLKAVYRTNVLDPYDFEFEGGTFAFDPGPRRASAPVRVAEPKPTLSPVKVPGADGPLTEHELIALKGEWGEQGGGSNTPLIAGTIALLVIGAALGLFFFLRARRRGSAESI